MSKEKMIKESVLDAELETFESSRRKTFNALIEELAEASNNPEEANFERIFGHAQRVLNLQPLDLSKLFKVSRPTVNRWTRGVTSPHPMLRKAVYDTLLEEAKKRSRRFN